MRQMRVKNVIIGHLNVNFMAPKIDAIRTIIPGNVDIMVFSETKLDDSYPATQLLIEGFGKPFRLDRNARGGGLLIYARSDIPCKQLSKHDFPDGINGIFVEIRFFKSKWLLFGIYHPPSQDDKLYFNSIGQGLDVYTKSYDNFLLIGDFNAEEGEADMENFMELYDLGNLIKEKTCFKSVENPSCVDLFLTNCVSFQNTKVISIGISDCHKMIFTVLKTTFKKAKPKEISYRSYKMFDNDTFQRELNQKIGERTNYTKLECGFSPVFNKHAPLKKREYEVPYMTRNLRKAIANRSRLENQYYKYKTTERLRAYKKQKKVCSRLYKKERKRYYNNLDVKKITDSRKFWVGKTEITMVKGDEIAQDDSEVANILGDFFSNSVRGLNIEILSEYKNEVSPLLDDPVNKIIATYSDHPSIKLINDNVVKGNFSFEEVSVATIRKQIMPLDDTKAAMSSSIPPKILKENLDIFCNPLTAIINSGISNSSFDKGLKLADVILVHKTDVTTDKKN